MPHEVNDHPQSGWLSVAAIGLSRQGNAWPLTCQDSHRSGGFEINIDKCAIIRNDTQPDAYHDFSANYDYGLFSLYGHTIPEIELEIEHYLDVFIKNLAFLSLKLRNLTLSLIQDHSLMSLYLMMLLSLM
ncbi:hypothetical protein ACFL0Q_05455 [Thermodesulfobacteriota bacterium]